MRLEGKHIALGVTGSIAAYKAAYLVRLLTKEGAEVRVISTDAANEFVTDLTYHNLSRNEVFRGMWDGKWTEHVQIGNWADLYVVAPCTANTIAKFAQGINDNAVTAVHLAAACPVVIAPAMDADMFTHDSTAANLQVLRDRGVDIMPSPEGEHASGLEGPGRFPEPEDILEYIVGRLGHGPLAGKRVLITAGPTVEAVDPVRFISNHSTGKMGYAIANEAHMRGAIVTVVSGPVDPRLQLPVKPIDVKSAKEMNDAVQDSFEENDIIIMAAAVSDFTPTHSAEHKIKKDGAAPSIELSKTTDILATVGAKKSALQFLVGFALESQNAEENGKKKLEKKNLDMIVVNSLEDEGAGFGHDTNKITILDKNGGVWRSPLKSKVELAKDILNLIQEQIADA